MMEQTIDLGTDLLAALAGALEECLPLLSQEIEGFQEYVFDFGTHWYYMRKIESPVDMHASDHSSPLMVS
jgi:hypothetical protein